jgi:hypothetical protein
MKEHVVVDRKKQEDIISPAGDPRRSQEFIVTYYSR